MPTIVVFSAKGARIHEGVNEADFKGQSYLVDPVFPKRLPPHQWKLSSNGLQIEGTATLPQPKRDHKILKYLTLSLLSFLLGYLIHRG
jgi:hypothetical protein